MTISGLNDVIVYFFKLKFRVFEHKKSAEGGLFSSFSSFWLDGPLYWDKEAPFELNCFWFLIFSTFFFLTSVILSRDRLVLFESLAMSDCWLTGFVPWESSVTKPSYPIFCIIDPWDILASKESVVMLIGVPNKVRLSSDKNEVKSRSNQGQRWLEKWSDLDAQINWRKILELKRRPT